MSFVHLQIRSVYSVLDSTIELERLVNEAVKSGYRQVALTDVHVMYGAIKFYQLCKKNNLKPIIGLTITIKEVEESTSFKLILLATNQTGYENLCKMSTRLQSDYRDGLPLNLVAQYSANLIAITPGGDGEIETCLQSGKYEEAQKVLAKYLAIFPTANFYLALHKYEGEEKLKADIKHLAMTNNLNLVAGYRVQFFHRDDGEIYKALQAVKMKTTFAEIKLAKNVIHNYWRTLSEARDDFKDEKVACENTNIIAERCHFEFAFQKQTVPNFPLEKFVINSKLTAKITAFDYLVALCNQGLVKRYKEPTDKHWGRLRYELAVIKKLNFSNYFLIVLDYVRYAKKNHIYVGPGRGSVAGSIVAYVLGITSVDPLKYKLIFERFLNPERISLPDIDIDFPDYSRERIINYLLTTYGQEHIAQIITFVTFGIKSALNEAGKILNFPLDELRYLSKTITTLKNTSIQEIIAHLQNMNQIEINVKKYRLLLYIAQNLESLPRAVSVHAAGIVITDGSLFNNVPLQKNKNNIYMTQFAMVEIEKLGLLKFDILGLRNLTIIENIIKSIEVYMGQKIDLNNITLADKNTYRILGNGDTEGIFQLESDGIRHVLQKMKPSKFEEVVAVISLYRPGPQSNIDTFIRRKHGKEKIHYLHTDLEAILKDTYGIIVYQEQIIRIFTKIAGYTLGEADLIRRAISKKDQALFKENHQIFITKAVAKGYEYKVAEKIYNDIIKFSDYGFNRSHAVSYSLISYQMAYLKANYTVFFFYEMLKNSSGQKIGAVLNEMKKWHINVLAPSINNSLEHSVIVNKSTIRLGFQTIKNVNNLFIKKIIEQREVNHFTDFSDFYDRVCSELSVDKEVENMIKAGCFDHFTDHNKEITDDHNYKIKYRSLYLGNLETIKKNITNSKQLRFNLTAQYDEEKPLSYLEILENEKEVLGFYVSKHPVTLYRPQRQSVILTGTTNFKVGKKIAAILYIRSVKEVSTKNGAKMAVLSLADANGEVEAIVYPSLYKNNSEKLALGKIYLFCGENKLYKDKVNLIINNIDGVIKK